MAVWKNIGCTAALSTIAFILSVGSVAALDLRAPDLRGTDLTLPADAPAPLVRTHALTEVPAVQAEAVNGVVAASEDAAVEDALPVEQVLTDGVGTAESIAASLGAPNAALRGSEDDADELAPDLTALTAAIPDEDVVAPPRSFEADFTLSGPRRASASARAIPRPTTSLTVLGRDITGKRNPRSSTVTLLGR